MKTTHVVLLLSVLAADVFAQSNMTVRAYRLSGDTLTAVRERMQSPVAERYFAQRQQRAEESLTEGLRFYLERSGVPMPDGAKVEWNAVRGEMIAFTTEDIHARIGRVLTTRSDWQIEVSAAWIAFTPAEIEPLARARVAAAPAMEDLLKLWQEKKGTLLQSGSMVMPVGAAGEISSGTDMRYVDQFQVTKLSEPPPEDGPKKGPADAGLVQAVLPHLTSTHAGWRVRVTPELRDDLATVELALEPELTSPPQWREATIATVERNGKLESVKMDVPQLHRQSLITRVLARDGVTMAVGGTPSQAGDQRVYLFVTPRVVDALGQPFSKHDFKGRLLE